MRFPGFSGNYKKHSFENLFNFTTGKNIKQSEVSPEFETPCIRYGELYHMYNEVIYKVFNKTNLDKSELVWLYQNATAAIYPSKGEGFGIPPLEATALECPSYSADNTALSELTPYLSGTFDNNENSIVTLLNKIEHEGKLLNLIDKSKQVITTFNWANSADILLKALSGSK